MKFIASFLIIMMMTVPAMGAVTFPFELESGTYELEVLEADVWTVRNLEAERNVRKEFADLKLKLEEFQLTAEIEQASLKRAHELEILRNTKVNSIELDYRDDKIEVLEDLLKTERRKGSFLGISTNYFSFLFGAFVTGLIAAGVN
jgi:hypothetical protein